MFLLAARLDRDRRRKLLQVTLGFAFASLLLGGMQLAGGTASGLRPYTVTNSDYPVGFFANVNHFATLLLCSIIFLGYVAAGFVTAARSRGQRNAAIAFGATAVTLLLVGLATTGSMAGLMLVFPALFAAYLVYRRRVERRVLSWLYPAVFIAFTLSIVALGLAGTIPSQALAGEVGASRLSRTTIAAKTIEAIEQHFPVGSGLGTFADVYRPLEDRNGLDREYMNHAHNDYLEWALELGIAGVLLTALFLFWWSSRVLQLWRTTADGVPLALAAGAAIGIILLHSLVEYPMRTSAIAVIFGMACAMLVPHSSRTSPGREPKKDLPSDRPRHMVAD
jgi:O-antigen ligase